MTSAAIQHNTANINGMVAIVIWFATPLMLVMTGDMPPFLLGAFSYLFSFAAIGIWWLYKGDNIRRKFRMSPQAYALGTYGIAFYNFLYIYAMKKGPMLEVSLLNYLWPAFLIIFGIFLEKTKLDIFAVIGILFCCAGSYFVFASRGAISFSGGHLMMMLGLVCAIVWGSFSSLLKHVRIENDQVAVFFLISGVAMLAAHLMYEKVVWPATILSWTMLLTYSCSRIAFLMWNYAMKHGSTRLLGSLSYFIPLFATLALVMSGYVTYNNTVLTGAALIISGCLIINLKALASGTLAAFRKVRAWQ
jgi:drug/metabolite transporter (DMT)-like permease